MPSLPFFRDLQPLVMVAVLMTAMTVTLADTRHYTVNAPDGVTLAVQESGDPDGSAVIFVHGLLGSHLSWDAQVSSPLLQHYRLITYDLRGHGLSGKPMDAAAYTDGRRWADDLAAVIAASGARDPVVVGWSLGAAVTTNYLAAYGDGHIAGALYTGGVIELEPSQIVAHPVIYRDLASPDLKTHLDAERAFLALCFETQPDAITFQRLLAAAALASPQMQTAVHSMTVAAHDGLGTTHKPLLLIYGARDALVQAAPSIDRARPIPRRVVPGLMLGGTAPPSTDPDTVPINAARTWDTDRTKTVPTPEAWWSLYRQGVQGRVFAR